MSTDATNRVPFLPEGGDVGRSEPIGRATLRPITKIGALTLVRGDGVVNLDMSILRNFPFGETRKVQFRAELFNVTNHPNFGNPGSTFGGPGFGIVSSAGPGRRIQLGARLVF